MNRNPACTGILCDFTMNSGVKKLQVWSSDNIFLIIHLLKESVHEDDSNKLECESHSERFNHYI